MTYKQSKTPNPGGKFNTPSAAAGHISFHPDLFEVQRKRAGKNITSFKPNLTSH